MSYVSKLLACAFISTIIFASSEVGAQSWQAKELVCRGQATLGNDTISDELVLRLRGDSIEIRGEPGTPATFDGTVYKVCFQDQDELDFEYTTGKCGTPDSTRFGDIQKVTGILKISRKDMGMSFVGNYVCKAANRVLN